ncbi:protein MpMAPKKK4 [Marchantia polymorpha subsp. ruderalis]|uniref:non-specific serine/threonine protein kinase n=1 Tax=Marchantia polymorpha TaxID=3197 RepID=A0A2R6X7J3_MARPO|nr:hypothetical protein MARPO_0031s0049 [Marchantia polymorpha]BBN01014.1 hypothetical protein Mp_2g03930 [Marchantia polymorpha subsp. ruderalis]|eukprot:PTQ42063.1 hypothetical protein MARPO_0031s0049 [Marchantia polymorpha]
MHAAKSALKKLGRSRRSDSPGRESPRSQDNSGSSKGSQISPNSELATLKPLTLLFFHSRNDNVDALQKLLKDDPSLANSKDYDLRTALHVAATYGCTKAARVLLQNKAEVNALDRWQTSPLADATNSRHTDLIKLLTEAGGEIHGSHGQEMKCVAPPTIAKSDWEIDPSEIDLSCSVKIGKGSFGEIRKLQWRGTPVAVKTILPALSDDKLVVQDFRHEVELLVKVRHPNIVQFLGAVTKKPPLMLITEYLPGGDLHVVLKEKGPLAPHIIVKFALDIARGVTYLHNGPNTIIHRDLKPRNVLLGESNQLKVGDFGLSKLMKMTNLHDIYKMTGETGSYRYMAPEVFEHRSYDKSVDVFSFAVILFEMFEGSPPFAHMDAYEAARQVARVDKRPPFTKQYPAGMKELIEECWRGDPYRRPLFVDIIPRLENINQELQAACPTERSHLWRFSHNHHGSAFRRTNS